MLATRRSKFQSLRSRESGQAAVFVVLALGLFLLGGVSIAIDGANLWFHRQAAQTAADAACTAGIMDMVTISSGGSAAGGWIGAVNSSFDCSASGKSSAIPCQYAALNGYTAAALSAGTPGADVNVSFPGTVSGVPACTTTTPPPPICTSTGLVSAAYLQVNVTDRVQTFFMALLGNRTVDVGAQAICGVLENTSPIPILVLNPSEPSTFTVGGNFNLAISGGPLRSIQVNSNDGSAVNFNGGSGAIDLSKANGGNGGQFAVVANQSQPSGPTISYGTAGSWVDPTSLISDPFASIPAPSVPSTDCSTSGTCVLYGDTSGNYGCPDLVDGCDIYSGGYYSQGITIKNGKDANGSTNHSATGLAVFLPGLYYLNADLSADSNSCLRPAYARSLSGAAGDGSGGTIFYFRGTAANPATLQVTSNSGTLVQKSGSTINFDCAATGTTAVPLSEVKCTNASTLPTTLTQPLSGNVLLGPCQKPTAGGTNYGDPLGTSDPAGEQRGMLFFQDRDINLPNNHQPTWGGGGGFGVAGNMYFHRCNSTTTSGSGSGANCASYPNAYTDIFTLGGGSSSNTWVVGDIIVDQLSFGGNPNLNMQLNPNSLYYTLKASLLQ
jgi:hypothetical protein